MCECVSACVYGEGTCTDGIAQEWKSEGILWELVLFFYRVSPWDQSQGIRHSKCLYMLRHLQGPARKFEVNELFMCAKWVLLYLDYDSPSYDVQ